MGAAVKNLGLRICIGLGRCVRSAGIPVLVYHAIDDSGSYISTPPAMFRSQMEYLRERGVRVMSMRELFTALDAGESFPAKAVVLTFDDALESVATAAWPVLRDCGFTATVYVPTDYVGQPAGWYARHRLPPMACLDWGALRELQAAGLDLESHGGAHQDLTQLPAEALRAELTRSKAVLEGQLGVPVRHFAYPYGAHNAATRAAVAEAGYRSAVVLGDGRFCAGDDALAIRRDSLDRIVIGSATTAQLSMEACLQGTYSWYVRAKAAVRGCFGTPPHLAGESA